MEQVIFKQHLTRIFSRLFSVRPQSIAVIGDWQTGKTTLLQQILNPEIYTQHKPEALNPLFFAYDLNTCKADWQQLLNKMCSDLAKATGSEIPEGNQYQVFQDLVKNQMDKYCIYMLFDNFELLTQNPQVPLEFYSYLRSLANSFMIAYVTTSRASLQSLCVNPDICESPFFNIFTNLELKGFSAAEVAELIAINNPERDPADCFKLCAGHPGLTLKWLGCTSKEEFICETSDYAQQWFRQFDKDAAEVLKAAAEGKSVPMSLKYLEESLRRKGYLDTNGKIAAEVFATYLQSHCKDEKPGLFKRLFKK